jgi:serine/threonine protein kinase
MKKEFVKEPKLTELFKTEVMMMKAIKNDNVVGFVDYLENSDSYFLIIEYCGDGDVDMFLKK